MQDGWPGVAHRVNDAVHVLSSGAWLGALVPLLIILWRVDIREADLALRRFSTAGHVIVALVIASGVIDTLSGNAGVQDCLGRGYGWARDGQSLCLGP
jgi:putative copper resistance protein D